MNELRRHRCSVYASPWPGVSGVRTESDRTFGRHFHATHGIGLVECGAQRSGSARGKVSAYAGDLIASHPGEIHDGQPLGAPSRRWHMIHVDAGVLASMAAPGSTAWDVEFKSAVIQDVALRAALSGLFGRLHRWNAQTSTAVDLLACEESLASSCGLLMARHTTLAPPPAVEPDIACVRDRLADELLRPPTLAELARMVGLSKFQLLRRFARVYGLPPHAWLQQQRTERVRRLIRDGEDLGSAALAAGYADQSHMSRHFTRQFGYTPGAWQRASRRGPLRTGTGPAVQ